MRVSFLFLVVTACASSAGTGDSRPSADGDTVADGSADEADGTGETDDTGATDGNVPDVDGSSDGGPGADGSDGVDMTAGADALDGSDGAHIGDDISDAGDASDGSDSTDTSEPEVWVPPAPACSAPAGDSSWQVLEFCRPGGWLSVAGTEWYDVWITGADGQAIRWNGCGYETLATGTEEDLWWVHRQKDADTWVVGAKGTALRYTKEGEFKATNANTTSTLFGAWGPSTGKRTIAVGFDPLVPNSGVVQAWDHPSSLEHGAWGVMALVDKPENPQPFKVTGRGNDIWIVGRDDLVWYYDGSNGIAHLPTGAGADGDWITVALTPDGDPVLVGGAANAIIAIRQEGNWSLHQPEALPGLQGVCFGSDGTGLATGIGATFLRYAPDAATWNEDLDAPFDLFNPLNPPVPTCSSSTPDYHACHIDPLGHIWAVGGNFLSLKDGAILHHGPTIPTPPP